MRICACAIALLACTEEPGLLVAQAGPDQIIEVGETITLDGSDSTGATYFTWTFGDGEHERLTTASTRHRWLEPGRYTVYLEVADDLGRTDTDSLQLTVHHPLLDTTPRSSTTLVASPAGDTLYALLPDANRFAVIDVANAALVDHIDTCTHPSSMSISDAQIAVACPDVDQIWIYQLTAGGPILTLDLQLDWGHRPFGVVFGTDDLFATLQGTGELIAFDPETGARQWTSSLGPDLRGLAWADGQLVISRYRSPDLGGQWWHMDEDGSPPTPRVLSPDPGPDSDTNSRGIPNYLQRLSIRPDGRSIVFPGLKSNQDRGTFLEDQALTPETTVRSVLRHVVLDPADGLIGTSLEEPLFDNRDFASAVAYSPNGETLFVAHLGAQVIDALDAWSLQRIGGFQDVGHGLSGMWVSPAGDTLWALLDFDRELVALSIDDLSASPIERARIDLLGVVSEPLDSQVLEGKRIFYSSLDPRMSEDAYISCGSCHLNGDDDRRTWDFTQRGEGLRNTTALQGEASPGHGPLHWTGNFDEVQDFENDIRLHMGGMGFLSDDDWKESADPLGTLKTGRSAELDALAAFVASLSTVPRSPYRQSDGSLSPSAERGQTVFEDPEVGCAECHVGPQFTDSSWDETGQPLLHDVGTLTDASGNRSGESLTGLDTPSLRGLHDTGPYLHDGSVKDLEALLITVNSDDLHGVTSELSDNEIADLIEYLLSLE